MNFHSKLLPLLAGLLSLAAGLACATLIGSPTSTPAPLPTAPPTAVVVPTEVPAPTDVPAPTAVQLPTAEALPQEYEVSDEGVSHIPDGQPGDYAHFPPSSGEHYNRVLAWDFYVEEIPPEYYVHNLEHGGIVVLYQCPGDCPETEQALAEFFTSAPPEDVFNSVKIVIGRHSQIQSPVVALAWGYQLDLDAVDIDALLGFYQRRVNRGPELVP